MRKAILLFVLCMLPFLGKAQSKTISIYWSENNATNPFGERAAAANDADLALERLKLQMDKYTLRYTTQWRDNAFADPNSLTVTNVRYGNVSAEELQQIDPTMVPSTLESKIASTMARDVLYTIVSISPIVKRNGSYQKVLSFDVDYRYGPQNRNDPP